MTGQDSVIYNQVDEPEEGPNVANIMTKRDLDRLELLLLRWHETHPEDGELRDAASYVRHAVLGEIEEREDR